MEDFFEFTVEADPGVIFSASKVDDAEEYVIYWMEEWGLEHRVYLFEEAAALVTSGAWRVLS